MLYEGDHLQGAFRIVIIGISLLIVYGRDGSFNFSNDRYSISVERLIIRRKYLSREVDYPSSLSVNQMSNIWFTFPVR